MSASKVVITGGTGVLGRAVTAAFLDGDARVAVTYVLDNEIDGFEAAVGGRTDQVALIKADLTDPETARAAMDKAAEAMGGLDVLCNIAGGFDMGPMLDVDTARMRRQMAMNFETAYLASRAAIPHIRRGRTGRTGGGKILFTGARPGLTGGGDMVAYASAKGAVHTMTRSLAEELKPDDIQVNAVMPSVIDTPGNRQAMPDADFDAWVRPQALAGVIRFLCSDEADIISGALIPTYNKA